MAAAFADVVVESFPNRIEPGFTLVLSGGPTARHCYERLADRGPLPPSTGASSTSSWATNAAWRPTTPTPTSGSSARRSSTGSAPVAAFHPMSCDRGRRLRPAAGLDPRPRPRPPGPRSRRPHGVSLPRLPGLEPPPGRMAIVTTRPGGPQPHERMTAHLRRHRPGPAGGLHRGRRIQARGLGRGAGRGRHPRHPGPGGRDPLARGPRRRPPRDDGAERRPAGGPTTKVTAVDRPRPPRRHPRRPAGRGPGRPPAAHGTGSPTRPRSSSPSPSSVATAAATAPSPSRRPAWPLPTCRPTRSWPSPGPGPTPAATRPSSPWAKPPRTATRWPGTGSTEHGFASTVDYLVAACAPGARRDGPAPPRQRRRPRSATTWPGSGRCRPARG